MTIIIQIRSQSPEPCLLKSIEHGQLFRLTENGARWVQENCRPQYDLADLTKWVFQAGNPPPGMSTIGGHCLDTAVQFGFGDGEIDVFPIHSILVEC